jgi:exodeoxyribonuclease-5
MSVTLPILSEDQAQAWDRLSHQLQGMGVDLTAGTITPQAEGKASVLAVVGKAGSGKTMLLASLYKSLAAAGVDIISGDYEGRSRSTEAALFVGARMASVRRSLRLRPS